MTRIKNSKHTILSAALLSSCLAFGQRQSVTRLDGSSISVADINKTVTRLMDAAQVPGLDLAILNNKKIVFIQSYGFKNKIKKELLDTASVMYGASFSKAVFGYLVMRLVQKKVIALDTPLYKYLGKPIAAYDYFSDLTRDERWKLITARMCLSHTTGLPNVRWLNPMTGAADTIGTMKIYFNPGTKYAYSGEGLKLLQLAVEEITKKTVEDIAIEEVFTPIGMTRTGYIWHERFNENYATGHLENGVLNPKSRKTKPAANGSMVTTIADYARFIEQVMQQKGLDKAMYKEMLSPQVTIHSKTQFPPITTATTTENDAIHLSYGLGWGLLKCRYGKAFFKEGHDDAWRNYTINFIDKGISIIIMTNSANGELIFKELLATLIGDIFTPWKWEAYFPLGYKPA